MSRAPAVLGILCFLVFPITPWIRTSGLPEWIPQLTWLALVTAAAAWCAYREPALGWKAGAIVMGVQPLLVIVMLLATGEFTRPSSSTSGMAAFFISTVFMAVLSPLPIGAAIAMAAQRRKSAVS